MIILDWNIRGLGYLDKGAKLRDFIYLFGFDVVALQESKFCSPTSYLLRSIWGHLYLVVLDSFGASEGQLVGWNESSLED